MPAPPSTTSPPPPRAEGDAQMKQPLRLLSLSLALTLCLGLGACGGSETGADAPSPTPEAVGPSTKLNKPPQSDQILSDLNSAKGIKLPNDMVFSDCQVIKRQSNPEQKEDIVYCSTTAESRFFRTQRQYRLLYNFYDEGGWILDEYTPENEDEWTDAYLDAAGNDILEDMVWLDAFSQDQFNAMRYLNECNGVHYLSLNISDHSSNSEKKYIVVDHTGKRLGYISNAESPYGSFKVYEAFPASDGGFRLIANSSGSDDNNHHINVSYLTDQDGIRLTEYYDWLAYSEQYGIVVAKSSASGTSLYGALDENGDVVVPFQHKNLSEVYSAVDPEYTQPRIYQAHEPPQLEINGIKPYMENANYVYSYRREILRNGKTFHGKVLVNAKGAPILPMEYGYASMIISENAADLVLVSPDTPLSANDLPYYGADKFYSFRIYDLDGNCRSPEFTLNDTPGDLNFDNGRVSIVIYQGRYGILPQLITDEESYYFDQQWGIDHQNDGEPLSGDILSQIMGRQS